MKNNLPIILLSAGMVVPMTKKSWTELEFSQIPSHVVTYSEQKMIVDVKKSASPLIYKFEKSVNIENFDLDLNFQGQISDQSQKFSEDSYFRLGLVAEGLQKLTGLKKMFAPRWVQKLFELAPENVGLDKIYFFNIMPENQKINDHRNHPKSELMEETIIAVRKPDQLNLKLSYQLPASQKISALWISIDGDDTKSEFQTTINKINLGIK